jgi:hypothetical protein
VVDQIALHLHHKSLQRDAQQVHQQLKKVMRTFGRQCRGQHRTLVQWVRQTERQLLEVGQPVGSLALCAALYLQEDSSVENHQQQRLQAHLRQAAQHYEQIEQQSRRLIHGHPLPHAKIVNPYDRTIAPIIKGKSNAPVQFGKKPGIMAEMATGFIFGLHLPHGNPDDASYVPPLIEAVDAAIQAVGRSGKPKIKIQSLAGDLAFRPDTVRQPLHARGILTTGIPSTTDPLPRNASAQQVRAIQQSMPFPHIPSDHQVRVATACGYSRPFVESLITQLAGRGGTHLKYKGHRGAVIQVSTAILAHNAATLTRILQNRLTPRAQRYRRWFRLRSPKPLKNNN